MQMIKHIVMFKLADKTPENLNQVINALRGMEGKIETLRYLEVGKDYSESERSYDVVLTTHFDNQEGLKTYISHENHLPVVEKIRALCSGSVVVDYIVD
jgi:hypothetical protein